MDLSFFTTPTGIAVIAAVGSFIAGVVGAGISSWTIRRTHSQRLAADEKLEWPHVPLSTTDVTSRISKARNLGS